MKYTFFLIITLSATLAFSQTEKSIRQHLSDKVAMLGRRSSVQIGKPRQEEILSNTTGIMKDADWQNNPSVAINRINPNLIMVGADDGSEYQVGMPVYLTEDAGVSWTTFRLPRIFGWQAFGNPVVAADNDGRFFYLYTAYNLANSSMSLFMASSSDGVQWKYGLPIVDTSSLVQGAFEYRPFMTVDNNPTSPYSGRVYAVWMHLDTSALHTEARLRWSDDHAKTWSTVISLPKDSGSDALQIHTGKHGEVFISYSTFGDSIGTHYLLISKDRCVTFTKHQIGNFHHYPQNSDPQESLKGGQIPATANVAISIDDNNIYSVYGSWEKQDSLHSSATLYFRSSNDFGINWNNAIRLGSFESRFQDRFFPFLCIDPINRHTSIIYYSSELDSSNNKISVISNQINENILSSSSSLVPDDLFNPLRCSANLQTTVGDYIGCDGYNGVYAAAWTQTIGGKIITIKPGSTGSSEILVYVNSPQSSVHFPTRVNADQFWMSDPFPNPLTLGFSNGVSVNFTVSSFSTISLSLFDETGKRIKDFFNHTFQAGSFTETLDLTECASGNYILQLYNGGVKIEKKILVIR